MLSKNLELLKYGSFMMVIYLEAKKDPEYKMADVNRSQPSPYFRTTVVHSLVGYEENFLPQRISEGFHSHLSISKDPPSGRKPPSLLWAYVTFDDAESYNPEFGSLKQ